MSIVVHHGHSVSSGHYVAYVKSAAGMWHLCDDQRVCHVTPAQVLSQQAYILMYARRTPREWLLRAAAPTAASKAAEVAVGTQRAGAQKRGTVAENGAGSAGVLHEQPSARVSTPAQPAVPQPAAVPQGASADSARPAPAAAPQQPGSAPVAGSSPSAAEAQAADALLRDMPATPPPRNGRVPRAMAQNLGINGRSTKNMQRMHSALSQRLHFRVKRPDAEALACASPAVTRRVAAAGRGGERHTAQAADQSDDNDAADENAQPVRSPQPSAAVTPGFSMPGVRIDPGVDELLRGSGRRQLAGIGTWDGVDATDANRAQKLVAHAQPKRAALDAHDEEYDRGKMKKSRRAAHGAGPGAAKFIAAHNKGQQADERQMPAGKRRRKERVGGAATG